MALGLQKVDRFCQCLSESGFRNGKRLIQFLEKNILDE